MNLILFTALALAALAAAGFYVRHVRRMDATLDLARHYRQDHPAYLRQDDVPMIDLTRSMPSLQTSLSPIEAEATSFAGDALRALALTVLGIAAVYLLFGFSF